MGKQLSQERWWEGNVSDGCREGWEGGGGGAGGSAYNVKS